MNFSQWQDSINDLRTKESDFQKRVTFELEDKNFVVHVDANNSFKAVLKVTNEELEMVKKFVEESQAIFKKEVADARYKAINNNLSSL